MLRNILLALVLALPVLANANTETRPTDVIVVTAERGKETVNLETAQSVDTVERSELDLQSPVSVTEAIQRLPGVGKGPAGESLNFWQQGFTIRGLGSQRVLTLTDGIRLTGQGAGYGGGNLSLYDVYSVERIELLRGPNSVLYGTDAFGGVINIITRQPTKRTEPGSSGETSTEYNTAWSLERTAGYIDLGNERVSAVFGGSYSENSNPKLADGTVADSGRGEKTSGFGRIRLHLSSYKTVDFYANFVKDQNVLAADSEIDFGRLGVAPILIQFPSYTRGLVGIDYRAQNQGPFVDEYRLSLNWQGIRREFDRTSPDLRVGAFQPVPSLDSVRVLTDDAVDTVEFSNQIRLTLGSHEIAAGVDLGRDTARAPEQETRIGIFPPVSTAVVQDPVWRNRVDSEQIRVGAYVRDRIALSDTRDFVVSARWDYFDLEDSLSGSSKSESGYSGSASLIQYVGAGSVYATVSSGFRIPDLSERFQQAVFTVVEPIQIIGNPDLDTERSYTGELGAKWQQGGFSSQVSVFRNRVENFITTTVINARPRIEQTVNTGTVDLWGWDASAEYEWQNFAVFANASRTLAPRSVELVRVSGAQFNYGVSTRVWNTDIQLVARTVLDSEDLTELDRTSSAVQDQNWEGFTTVDVFATREFDLGLNRMYFTGGVKNIGNTVYREPFFNRTQTERSYQVTVGVRF